MGLFQGFYIVSYPGIAFGRIVFMGYSISTSSLMITEGLVGGSRETQALTMTVHFTVMYSV